MKKPIIITLISILVLSLVGLVYYLVLLSFSDDDQGPLKEIPGWYYRLEQSATPLMIEEFSNLKEILTAEEVDYDAYAKALSRLFVADLYTLSNKVNKYDVTSAQFLLPSFKDNFILNVQNTLYRFLEDNTSGNRTQALPEVNSITTINLEIIEFEIDEEMFEAYQITLNWTFIEDMGYDTEAIIILIREDKFLRIVEKRSIELES